jgi:hypothetical protein
MNSPEVKAFIRDQSSLFWYTPADQKENISEELLVETILNYGDMNAIKKLIALLGIERLSEIFNGLQERKKLNYYPEIYNFFSLLVAKHAHSDI